VRKKQQQKVRKEKECLYIRMVYMNANNNNYHNDDDDCIVHSSIKIVIVNNCDICKVMAQSVEIKRFTSSLN
jgi:hypothetical protein